MLRFITLMLTLSGASFSDARFMTPKCPLAQMAPSGPSSLDGKLERLSQDAIMDELSPEMVVALKAHPIWKKFHGPGKDLAFSFKFVNGTLLPGEIKEGEMGESIQSHFIAATLKHLFPDATLYAGDEAPGKRYVRLFAIDPAEIGQGGIQYWINEHKTKHFMPMPLLKSANGRGVPQTKEEVRAELKIPPGRFVVHGYNFHLEYGKKQESQLLNQIPGVKLADVIYVATSRIGAGPAKSPDRYKDLYEKDFPGFKIHLLSRMREGDLSAPGPHLIINDSRGRVPAINKMADVVLMSGPQNLFESINAGTPLVFQPHEGESPQYDKAAYDAMAEVAISSGGGYIANTPAEFSEAIGRIKASPPKITPSYAVSVNGKTPFESYLDALDLMLSDALPPARANSR